jgi:hypothetical protein
MASRRIDDHSSFAGKSGKYPLPEGNKMKEFRSAEGAGKLNSREMDDRDTSEGIHSVQEHGEKKVKGYAPKPGYRY